MQTYLIRHGATDANEAKPYILQGRSLDLPLSQNGIHQAAKTAQFLSKKQIQTIYSSPMKRALETAHIIANECNVAIEVTDEIIECNLGLWEKMTWDQIKAKYLTDFQWYISDPGERKYPKGESYKDVLNRVLPFFNRIAEKNIRCAVVSHGIVNKAYMSHLLKIPIYCAKDLPQNNCAINIINYATGDVTLHNVEHLY